jgi:hypothetical protein
LSGRSEIEIWGDGKQTRSFTYIYDCLEGTLRLTASDVREPLNIGFEQLVTINELVDIVEDIAGAPLVRSYNLTAPLSVSGCNSDNTLIGERLGRVPSITLEDGLQNTYRPDERRGGAHHPLTATMVDRSWSGGVRSPVRRPIRQPGPPAARGAHRGPACRSAAVP